MLLQALFKSGRLLLEDTPVTDATETVAGMPVLFVVLAVAFVLAAILFLPRFLSLAPLLFDSLFRARGSVSLESSVRASNDRRLVAAVLLLPAALITYHYRLYDAAFLRDLSEGWRLLAVLGVIWAYAMVRLLIYLILKPRRNNEFFVLARRTSYTYFILMMVVVLVSVGILSLFRSPDAVIRQVLYTEFILFYFSFLLRRAHILGLSCNPLRTFLYLCALEILPTAALVVSAILL